MLALAVHLAFPAVEPAAWFFFRLQAARTSKRA